MILSRTKLFVQTAHSGLLRKGAARTAMGQRCGLWELTDTGVRAAMQLVLDGEEPVPAL